MKIAVFVAIALAVATSSSRADSVAAEKPAHAGFEKMKSLAGTWKGKTKEGTDVTVTYRIVSAGNAVEEQLSVADMVTMYHADGDSVMLTHYCAGNNQPRMRAAYKAGDKTMSFAFVDAANLPDPKASHMHSLTLTFVDADHLTAEWTTYDGGKEAGGVTMDLERAK